MPRLGTLDVPLQGLGCQAMSEFYGHADEAESIATIHRAIELGVTLLDTADAHGHGANERLVGRAISGQRDNVVIATKFGMVHGEDPNARAVSGRPEYVREACEHSLRRLGADVIDLYYQHRIDPDVPIEETVGAMAELVAAGKIRHLGLCGATPEQLRRAHAVHPISALQTELSLWSREALAKALPACRELGVGFVADAPLGRETAVLPAHLEALARARGVTARQLALAWVHAQGDDVVPIPATRRRERLEEHTAAVGLNLTAAELAALEGQPTAVTR
jgi:aryl-alcohol dehydrogenase-like predicted oxidoreductase